MQNNRNSFLLGGKDTGMAFVFGGHDSDVNPSALDCHITDVQMDVPADIGRIIKAIETAETDKALRNLSHAWNGLLPHLTSFSRQVAGDERSLRLNFILARYYHFMATHVRPLELGDGSEFADIVETPPRLSGWDCQRDPAPGVVNAIPLNLAILTADHRIAFSRRSKSLAIAPGVIACAINENLDPVQDRIGNDRLCIQKLVNRAMLEEAGLHPGEWSLCLRGLAVSLMSLSYSLLGHATVNMPFDELVERCSQHARDRFEIDYLISVPLALDDLCAFIHLHGLYNCEESLRRVHTVRRLAGCRK